MPKAQAEPAKPHYLTVKEMIVYLTLLKQPDALLALSSDSEGNSTALIDSRMVHELEHTDGKAVVILIPSGPEVEIDLTAEDLAEINSWDKDVRHLDGQGE